VIVGIRHFLDPEPYEQLYLPPHVIVMILRFSPQPDSLHGQIFRKAGQKKAETNRPMVRCVLFGCRAAAASMTVAVRTATTVIYTDKILYIKQQTQQATTNMARSHKLHNG
jgi:hypothetical protein